MQNAKDTIKKNDWNNRWDGKPRLFSYLPPLIIDEYKVNIENERLLKINNRSIRYFP
jgi:hypothetical protein